MRLIVLSILSFWPFFGHPVTSQQTAMPEEVMRGVDVSHHQKKIEWDTVAAHKEIEFAFVKATEGADYVDTTFSRNWEALNRVGIRRGAYHFFRAYGCGYDQAQHYLSVVSLYPGDLAPVVDVELLDGVSPEVLRQELADWLKTVESSLHIKPIIYTNQRFYERFLANNSFDQYPLWIARYSDEHPYLADGRIWDIWQHTNEGCVEGISEKVDLNTYVGSKEMFNRLCWTPDNESDVAP